MGKLWTTCGNDDPTCGNGGNGSCSAEDIMASHLNTGSKRTYTFMQKMFFYEPVGVFEDFSVGLKESGLRLKLRHQARKLPDAVKVTVRIPVEGADGKEEELITNGVLLSDHYDELYDELELRNTIGKFNQRILLLNGTEDLLIVVSDVENTYKTICINAENAKSETGSDPAGAKPVIYTVGKGVGGDKPYSHFDLVFGEDAPDTVFPAILSFLEGTCEGRYQVL